MSRTDNEISQKCTEVAKEIPEIFHKYNLSQQGACYASIQAINQMSDIAEPNYAQIKLIPFISLLKE